MDSLAKLSQANRMLAEASTMEDFKQIRSIAQAAAEYAKAAKLGLEAQNTAAEIKIRAERMAGSLLAELKREGGGAGFHEANSSPTIRVSEYKQALTESETTRDQANKWQRIATIPDEQFESVIELTKENGQELTTSRMVTVAKMGVHWSSVVDEWETPQWLFDALNEEFTFTLDVCALDSSAKCDAYFTPEVDGLNKSWGDNACWMNPPYGNEIGDWMAKAYAESLQRAKVVCLVPARTDTNWWWDYAIFGEIRFLKGRLKFGNQSNSAPFPSAVIVFPAVPSVKWWRTNG